MVQWKVYCLDQEQQGTSPCSAGNSVVYILGPVALSQLSFPSRLVVKAKRGCLECEYRGFLHGNILIESRMKGNVLYIGYNSVAK